ncbi:MAG: hypothetical protein AB7I49_03700 [Candidatus Nitrosocosmicus sp.]
MGIGFAIGTISFSVIRYYIQKVSKNSKQDDKDIISNSPLKKEKSNDFDNKNNSNMDESEKRDGSSSGSGKLVIVGTVADSHPETLMISIMIVLGIAGLAPTVLALFVGNFTATAVGTRQLIHEGKPQKEVLRKWFLVFIVVFAGGFIGFFLPSVFDERLLSVIFGFAAGALISFVTEELIPYAYKKVSWHIGLSTALGLFVSFTIFHFL